MIKTNHKGIFFTVGAMGVKTYYGRYTNRDKKRIKVKLGTNLKTAISKLASLKRNESNNTADINSKIYGKEIAKALKTITLSTAYAEFKRVEFPTWSYQEQKTKKSRFEKWILPKFGSMEVTKIKYSNIQEYINTLDDKNTRKEIKCSRKSQEHIKSSIQALFTFLIKQELYSSVNPCKYVTIKPFDNHVPMTLTVKQISTFYQNIINIDTTDLEMRKKRLMLILMIHGRRLNEARQLEKCELRFLTNEYVIPAHKSKDGKTHYHKLTKFLRRELLELQLHLKEDEPFLFTNPRTKKPYKDISNFFTSVKMASNIPSSFRCQDFRHVVGTIARNQLGMPLEDIRDVLGHSTVKTTEIYSEKNSDNSRTVNNQLFDLFGLEFD